MDQRVSAREAQRIAGHYKRVASGVYQQVTAHAYRAIRVSLEARPYEHQLEYAVPQYLSGLPLYDRSKAAQFVAGELRDAGYEVTPRDGYNYILLISWGYNNGGGAGAATEIDSTGRRVMFFGS